MIDSGEDFSNSSGVRDHAYSSHNFSEITTWDNSWWLIVDTTFETSWAPINELDSSLGFDSSNRGVHILWNNITSVHHTASHIFTVSWVTFGHHGSWFESRVSDFSNWELFMISFFSRDNWGVRGKHEMNTRIWHKVGLEFSDIDVKGTIESKRGSKWGNNLSNKSVQVSVGWSFNIKSSSTDIVDGFIIKHDCNISMLKKRMGWEYWVVWFNNGSRDLWGWVDGETEFGFFTVINRKSFEEEGSKSRSSTTTNGVEY